MRRYCNRTNRLEQAIKQKFLNTCNISVSFLHTVNTKLILFSCTGDQTEVKVQQEWESQSQTESCPRQSRRSVGDRPCGAPEPQRPPHPDLQTPGDPCTHAVPQKHVSVPEEQRWGPQYGMSCDRLCIFMLMTKGYNSLMFDKAL